MISVVSTRGIGGLAQAAILVVLVRGLGPVNFGYFTLITTIVSFLAMGGGLGLTTLALRIGALNDPEAWARQTIRLRNLTIWVSGLVVYFIASTFMGTTQWVIIMSLLAAIFEMTSGHLEATLFGLKRVKAAQQSLVSRRILVLVSFLAILATDVSLEIAYSCSLVLAMVASNWWTRSIARRGVPLKEVLTETLPYWVPSVLTKLTTVDIIVARMILPASTFGTFSAANRVVSTFQLVPASLLSIFTPHLTTANSPRTRAKTARKLLNRMSWGALGLVAISPALGFLISLIAGPQYSGLLPVATILIVAFAAECLSQVITAYFYAANAPKLVNQATALSLGIGLVILLALGFWWGAVGASLGVLSMRAISAASLYRAFRVDAMRRQ